MRGPAVLLLGLLLAGLLGGCRSGCGSGCRDSGWAPCVFTYEVNQRCERTWRPCEPQARPAPPLLPCDD